MSMHNVYEIAVALCPAVEIEQWKLNQNLQISEKSFVGKFSVTSTLPQPH